ncbi:MAG TPA: 1-(5-phosphoribosyl)-5-[(5-phosphoribosylamino)methylideneamino]imidazole-4-carboxamide isomerase [Candidatus Omnitrophota bacterium]|nr:1-(5-phosphoribosyl)-5-[(5-phosphoribosylamino)methylideneamino]imidazole-4-carboxamide isomerase [Candidatus Omnitrophota bacterium]HPT07501.1 1-(5-phosphoribosyl)-5-[(5-phosphoribosylamino)methylideneamino]imidazole-4-carboxamide isomerase [Candidatus Omnitrophota bacterium]
MLIIPAIDIQKGVVVRLFQGVFEDKTVYSDDPLKTARHWVDQGALMLHVVDLDGAAMGEPQNFHAIKRIARAFSIPIQCGGGARSFESVTKLFDAGVSRVVLGTKAVEDRDFLEKVFKAYTDRVIVSIDAKNGEVLVNGWQAGSGGLDIFTFGIRLAEIGFRQVIFTDTSKDGTLEGPNIAQIRALVKETKLKVIASGGISKLDDIKQLKEIESEGVIGVIIGKALYEEKFTLKQANAIA